MSNRSTMRPVKFIVPILLVGIIVVSCLLAFHPGKSSTADGEQAADQNANDAVQMFRPLLPTEGPAVLQGSDTHAPTSIADYRSDACRKLRHIKAIKSTATLVVDLPVDSQGLVQLERLRSTVDTLVSGSQQHIDEVLVVGAADSQFSWKRTDTQSAALRGYLDNLGVKATLIPDAGKGRIGARRAGAGRVRSDVVVFVDCDVRGTAGWLRPLIDALISTPNSIAVPHQDEVLTSGAYSTSPEQAVGMYLWPLTTRVIERPSIVTHAASDLFRSPVVRGNIVAVEREFFDRIGGYDERLPADDLAAAHAELSLRVWLCGAGIYVVPCSRIGVYGLYDPIRVRDETSVRVIAETWFGERKNVLMRSSGVAVGRNASGVVAAESRSKPAQCKDIDSYFAEVAMVPVPSPNADQFGQLRSKTDLCAHVHKSDGRVDMTGCWPRVRNGRNLSSMTFELTNDGLLRTGDGRCLTVQSNSYVLVDACTLTIRAQQVWRYDGVQLVNPWSNFCAMHVSDPENIISASQWRQIIMAQNCTVDLHRGRPIAPSDRQFMGWKFVNP